MTDEKKAEELTQIDKAVAAAERLEAATAKFSELLDKQEALKVADVLAGKAVVSAPESKPLTDKEYAEAVMRGETPRE